MIADIGRIDAVERKARGVVLFIETELVDGTLSPGDSLAVDGVCLTVVGVERRTVAVEAISETLSRTTLGRLDPGDRVNLERPLRVGDRLDGHLVSGHIDGLGRVRSVEIVGTSQVWTIEAPAELLRYMVEKGSVAVDGISLTISALRADGFQVSLIPHTLGHTTFVRKKPGSEVNLEADVLGKYVERLLERRLGLKDGEGKADGVSLQMLEEHGFLE